MALESNVKDNMYITSGCMDYNANTSYIFGWRIFILDTVFAWCYRG